MKDVMMKLRLIAALLTASTLPLAMPISASAQMQSDGYKFLKAVRDQDVLKTKELFDEPGSTVINTRDFSTGEGALHIVVKRRDVSWINFLAQAGANLEIRDNEGKTPLTLATQLGFIDGVRVLLARNADVNSANTRGESALIFAVQARDANMVKLLVDNGANPDQKDRITGNSARDYASRDARNDSILRILDSAKPKKSRSNSSFGPF